MEEFINGYMKFRMNMLTHQIETQLIADAYTDRPEASACHWQRLTDHIENSCGALCNTMAWRST